ncbi:hypothetical protein NLX86_06660 [Streptomyces sp. A3M-1-3]|uniref:hypothetical protein n=1 Tax=Streptomyces sp. A3M-1-3 TaxID=2962044 RepID=UPI0020B693CA|nr:hypothetical protein [Streptomyces sp. A3M-1-3]MCP3817828.1 hypothetical protein [Streptomyces sp. A3M-1-3]
MPEPKVFDEDTNAWTHGAAIADPASPGAAYAQAEAVAVRNAVVAILAAMRSAGLIAQD